MYDIDVIWTPVLYELVIYDLGRGYYIVYALKVPTFIAIEYK